ncbi:MAG TPA: hypothetical protein VFG37_12545 [Planctomycetota bacterium]|nr:hypothetical protein [Planctomycetota bacterium]
MTKTLARALAKMSRLPARDQDSVARWLLAELESESRWSKAFRRSADRLAELADEALKEHRDGRTRRLGKAS